MTIIHISETRSKQFDVILLFPPDVLKSSNLPNPESRPLETPSKNPCGFWFASWFSSSDVSTTPKRKNKHPVKIKISTSKAQAMDPVSDPTKSSVRARRTTLNKAIKLHRITTEILEAKITVGIRMKAVGIMENFTKEAGEMCHGDTKRTQSAVMQR